MPDISFIVEGKEDIKFLQDFIKHHFGAEITSNSFIEIGGKSETIYLSKPKIQSSSSKGNLNIMIFDADDHDFTSTLNNLNLKKKELSLIIDQIFLFPNNQSNGNLESLLRKCIPNKNQSILDCIKQYEECKQALTLDGLRSTDKKEELFIYHGSFVDTGNAKATERNYLNAIWNLDCEEADPLKDFLAQFFK